MSPYSFFLRVFFDLVNRETSINDEILLRNKIFSEFDDREVDD